MRSERVEDAGSIRLLFDPRKFCQEVVKLVDLEETLVLVTADHAHTMR